MAHVAMLPSQYAARYLPVVMPGPAPALGIYIRRYHIGAPTAAQQQLWGALGDYFLKEKKKDAAFQLALTVNNTQFTFNSREDLRMIVVRPFYGKGSPEDCQIVLQLTLLLGIVRSERLQAWADTNLGLDCNGFVGNYIFHEVMNIDWRLDASGDMPGPSSDIQTIFRWIAGKKEEAALEKLDQIDARQPYVIVRVDSGGTVIPGGPTAQVVGHIAITEPGGFMAQSFVHNSMGGIDPTFVQRGLYAKPAVRTVEFAGPVNGVGQNWLVFTNPTQKTAFDCNRDGINFPDKVKISPLPKDFQIAPPPAAGP